LASGKPRIFGGAPEPAQKPLLYHFERLGIDAAQAKLVQVLHHMAQRDAGFVEASGRFNS
jgi:hypothetical protein